MVRRFKWAEKPSAVMWINFTSALASNLGLIPTHAPIYGERTCMEAFEWVNNPVMLTHSNPKVQSDHPRCVTDNVINACSETGGTVGVTGYIGFLAGGDTSAENHFRHIDYVVQLNGPEHVDFASGYIFDPDELESFLANPYLYLPCSHRSSFPI